MYGVVTSIWDPFGKPSELRGVSLQETDLFFFLLVQQETHFQDFFTPCYTFKISSLLAILFFKKSF